MCFFFPVNIWYIWIINGNRLILRLHLVILVLSVEISHVFVFVFLFDQVLSVAALFGS